MKKKFTITIEKKGTEFEAKCQAMPDAIARGRDMQEAIDKISAVIRKKLEGGSDSGSAPIPQPIRPPPRGPTSGFHQKPDA